jgi:membrane associated rhomboid family serine protease
MTEPTNALQDVAQPLPAEPQTRTVSLRLPVHPAVWTYVLLGANVLVWLAMTAYGWRYGYGLSGSEYPDILVLFGAKYSPYVAAGEYWRLLTACFLHIGPLHLLFNSWALFSFGPHMERRFGGWRYLSLYLLAGIAGNVLSFLGSSSLSAGASGAIFGLIGAAIVYYATYRQQFGQSGRRQLTNVLIVAGYNLVFGLTAGGIDNLGHLGGLAAGLLLGWAFCPRYEVREPRTPGGLPVVVDEYPVRRAWAVLAGLLAVLVVLTLLATRAQA